MKTEKMMSKWFAMWLFVILGSGCALESNQLLRPGEYPENTEHDLAVYTLDGRRIDFPHHAYSFAQDGDSTVLKGSGTLHLSKGRYVGSKFNGQIPVQMIEKIEIIGEWDPSTSGLVVILLVLVIPLAYYGL